MDVKDLERKRGEAHAEAQSLVNKAAAEKRALTPVEQARFDALIAQRSSLDAQIRNLQSHEEAERWLSQSRGRQTETVIGDVGGWARHRNTDADLALRAWALGPRRATREMLDAAERMQFRPEVAELGQAELRALSVGTTDKGGYSVPDEMMRAFWDAQKWFGSVRNVSTLLTTSTGAALPIPVTDDTSNTGEIVAEAGAVTTTADPVYSQVVLDTYKYSSKAIIVSVELLMDSFINLPAYLGRKLGERIARIQNTHYTTGDGSSKPRGVVTAANVGKTAAATNAIIWDEVIDLMHAVDPAYRARPKAGFMMHDSVASYLRKLKDSQNRYLWELSLQAGQPDRILGKPVYINNDMSSTFATNNRLVAFGDFEAYHVREAGPPIFARSDDLRLLTHEVVFLCWQRADGDLVDANAVKVLRTA